MTPDATRTGLLRPLRNLSTWRILGLHPGFLNSPIRMATIPLILEYVRVPLAASVFTVIAAKWAQDARRRRGESLATGDRLNRQLALAARPVL